MREMKYMIESLKTATGVSQRGFDQPARETAGLRTKTKTVDRTSGCTLNKARSETDTSVVAAVCSRTQNDEETKTERWWAGLLETGYFMLLVRH